MLAIRLSAEHKRCKRVFQVGTVVSDQFSELAVAYNSTREALVGSIRFESFSKDKNDVRIDVHEKNRLE